MNFERIRSNFINKNKKNIKENEKLINDCLKEKFDDIEKKVSNRTKSNIQKKRMKIIDNKLYKDILNVLINEENIDYIKMVLTKKLI